MDPDSVTPGMKGQIMHAILTLLEERKEFEWDKVD